MKKYMDKLKSNIHINKNLFVFLLVLVITGLIAGALFSVIISGDDKALVTSYLMDFFNNAKDGKLNYNGSIVNTLFFTLGISLFIWLLGISVIGFFVVIFILFLKSFIIGFSLGSIIYVFKLKGVLLSFVYVFPHHVINLFIFMLLSAFSLVVSYKLISSLKSKKAFDFKGIINRYLVVLGFSIFVLIFTSLYEVFVVPRALGFIMNVLK